MVVVVEFFLLEGNCNMHDVYTVDSVVLHSTPKVVPRRSCVHVQGTAR